MTEIRRFGQVINLKPRQFEAYKLAHDNIWQGVLAQIERSNIRNYSIFAFRDLLFAYFEYIGEDFEADMTAMAEDPMTQDWWAIMQPMQTPVSEAAEGQWWHNLDEIFHAN